MQESIEAKQLRSRLGSYLNHVQEGHTIVVTRQGQAIAELRPHGMEQAGRVVQNGARGEPEERQDEAIPIVARVGALGLTTYACQTGQERPITGRGEEVAESQAQAVRESQAPESHLEQTMSTELPAALSAEEQSAESVSRASLKPAKPKRPSRSRKANTATPTKRRQSRGVSARKKMS